MTSGDDPSAARIGDASQPPPNRAHLLVAEDHVANQKVALAMLQRLGWAADVVATGTQAVEAFHPSRYAAILMDCQMPDLDGYAATAAIRSIERGDTHTPIIALTASSMGEVNEKCLAAGMDDFIPKPIMLDELDATLRRWISSPPNAPSSPTTAASSDAAPTEVFDPERVATLRAVEAPDVSDHFTYFAAMFVGQAGQQVAALDQALSHGDDDGARYAAHLLRGGAATVGAVRLADACGALEDRLAEGRQENAETLALIRFELDRVRSTLEGGRPI